MTMPCVRLRAQWTTHVLDAALQGVASELRLRSRHARPGQGDLPARAPGMVSRADVAAICCAAISAKDVKNTTFEIVTEAADSVDPDQLNAYFAGLIPGKHDEPK